MNELDDKIQQLGRARLFGYFENQSPEWLEARAGIGGSDVGTILGENQYKTRQELLNEKRFGAEPLIPNLAMRMGTKFESGIRDLWAEDNATWLTVHETGTWQGVANPEYKGNPDGIIEWATGELGLLEIKYSQAREVPSYWYWQVNFYLSLLGLKRGIIVQCSGNKLLEHVIDLEPDVEEYMLRGVNQFLEEMRSN
jgi:predicted phage-related endonuclease